MIRIRDLARVFPLRTWALAALCAAFILGFYGMMLWPFL